MYDYQWVQGRNKELPVFNFSRSYEKKIPTTNKNQIKLGRKRLRNRKAIL